MDSPNHLQMPNSLQEEVATLKRLFEGMLTTEDYESIKEKPVNGKT